MSTTDERSRLSAHVLLDMISAQDFNTRATADTEKATRIAFTRLNEIDAVTATRDDETEITTIDSTPLMSACGSLIVLLMSQVEKQGYERDGVIIALRETIDELYDG